MGDIIGNMFKGAESAASAVSSATDDFADYAASAATASGTAPAASLDPLSFANAAATAPPASPWYALWERHTLSDFKNEAYILLLISAVILMHIWGTRRNRKIAKDFLTSIAPVLGREFASVGFTRGQANTLASEAEVPFNVHTALRENSNVEFTTYASGRANAAFLHATIKLQRRSNLVGLAAEHALSFFFDSFTEPRDTVTLTLSPFDGAGLMKGDNSQKFDNFIWALVNKRAMKRLREERYDLSLTRTTDWEGLPNWVAVMGEGREIGELCLTKELKEVVPECRELLEMLLVTDMPKEKPKTLEDMAAKKRFTLQLTLPRDNPERTQKLLSAFIRLVDHLTAKAHFRPEVLRKVTQRRDEEMKKLKKVLDEQTKEERETAKAERKKAEREAKLRGMSDREQKKFLEKEREREQKQMAKKMSRKA